MTEKENLHSLFIQNNIEINGSTLDKLLEYKKIILEQNRDLNLISKPSVDDFDFIHLIDSALPAYLIPDNATVADLGTGGGLPGIVLKIINPTIELILIDSKFKKTDFLKSCLKKLEITNASVFNPSKEKNETHYDIIVSRAFGTLKKIVREAKKFCKEGSTIIAYKGKTETVNREKKQIENKYNCTIKKYNLVAGEKIFERHTVCIKRK